MKLRVQGVVGYLLVFIMAAMVINVLWQVASRYLMGVPSSFTEELARYLMIWLGLLGAAYVAGLNQHVAIDLLPSKFDEKTQKRLRKLVFISIMTFALLAMVIGGCRLVYLSFELGQKSPALQIPLAFVYAAIPLSGILIIYFKISDFLKI